MRTKRYETIAKYKWHARSPGPFNFRPRTGCSNWRRDKILRAFISQRYDTKGGDDGGGGGCG